MMQVNTSFKGDGRRSGVVAEGKGDRDGGSIRTWVDPASRRLCVDKFFGFKFPRKLASQNYPQLPRREGYLDARALDTARSSRLYWKISYFAWALELFVRAGT